MPLTLIYDGQCPVCSRYVRHLRLQALPGGLQLVDARNGGDDVAEARRRGLRIDDGMVLRVGDEWSHGADAMHRLALLSTPSGAFNRLNYWLFRSSRRAALAYPVLKLGRNLLLRLLGRKRLGF
jgi:predicted DCC family thiol-disulfide oxidoreductase YuxK